MKEFVVQHFKPDGTVYRREVAQYRMETIEELLSEDEFMEQLNDIYEDIVTPWGNLKPGDVLESNFSHLCYQVFEDWKSEEADTLFHMVECGDIDEIHLTGANIYGYRIVVTVLETPEDDDD